MGKKLFSLGAILVCCILTGITLFSTTAPANAAQSIVPPVQKLIRHYQYHPDTYNEDYIRDLLDEITEIDAEAGGLWETIMENWIYCNTELEIPADVLPDGLPEDNSMCIVVLGYALNNNGTMKPELIARLETALRSAEKYPEAYIAVTGGGTAAYSDETEAEAMARWLLEQGISEDRLIVETEAMSTTYNAVNTYAMLVKSYPEVTGIALITSDYHIPWGWSQFQTVCDYTEVYGKTVIPVIACAANTTKTTMNTMHYQANGICTITGIPSGSGR